MTLNVPSINTKGGRFLWLTAFSEDQPLFGRIEVEVTKLAHGSRAPLLRPLGCGVTAPYNICEHALGLIARLLDRQHATAPERDAPTDSAEFRY